MSAPAYHATNLPLRERLTYQARILRVLSRTDFKLKYAGSVLGYLWSVTKPLMYFTVLWLIFGSLFKSGLQSTRSTSSSASCSGRSSSTRSPRPFPRSSSAARFSAASPFRPIVIPVAATLTAVMSFLINLIVVVVFIVGSHVGPNVKWLLLVPLFLELYLFVLGTCVIASTLYVRFRDVSQIWEVAAPILFFSAPIMYPVAILPVWLRHIVVFNPFVQVLQDTRRIILGPDANAVRLIGFHGNHAIPIAVTIALLVCAFWLYRRDSPRFAELA